MLRQRLLTGYLMSGAPIDSARVKAVFDAAVLLDSERRAAYVADACGSNTELREEVEALLAAHERAATFLETPAVAILIAAPAEDVVGRSVDSYRIVSRLGAGGMGDVYKAHDAKLDREVALKLLPRDAASNGDRLRRFHGEARAASSLNHPNIVVIHDFGALDGRPFIVSELVDGETLRARLRRGAMPLDEALRVSGQIADALSAAHARNIVHRDIKPENVMVRPDGYVKVLDFGLAKLLESPPPAMLGVALRTQEGAFVGTPHYVSPEQAEGKPVDARSDVFSLGVILYEMTTGVRPFNGDSQLSVLSAILRETPKAMTEFNPALPAGLTRIVNRCLEKDPGRRYQSASALRDDLTALAGELASDTPRRLRVWRLAAALAIAAAIVAGFAVWRASRTASAAGSPSNRTRIAVLPFENLTNNRADDWLAGAFSDSLTSSLQDVETLIPVSRDRIVELYRQHGIQEAAAVDAGALRRVLDTLRVRYFVHGGYQRVGDQIKVSARLVAADSGAIEAQESVTDGFASLLKVEDTLNERFAGRLHHAGTPQRRVRAPTMSIEAHQAFVEARTLYAQARHNDAVAFLVRATTLDPQYADAWALAGKNQARLAAITMISSGNVSDIRRDALRFAQRAVELAPSLYDAHVALALAYREVENFREWRAEALKAIELNPRMAEAFELVADSYFAGNAFGCGRDRTPETAERYFQAAIQLDPLWAAPYANLSYHFSWLGREEDALRIADQGLAVLSTNPNIVRARALTLIRLGRASDAEQAIQQLVTAGSPMSGVDHLVLGSVALSRGNGDVAAREFETTSARLPTTTTLLAIARAYLDGHQIEPGLTHLDRAVALDASCAQFAATTPAFAPYRETPQFRARLVQWTK